MLFDSTHRTDASPARYGESRFAFLNRSASDYFGAVRDLMESWLANVPAEERQGLVGRLRSDGPQHEAAFWELYLHEAYRRSGWEIEIHPEVPAAKTRPDFRITNPETRGAFYLEAVSVGQPRPDVAEENRLNAVYAVLASMQITDFRLSIEALSVGDHPLPTKPLRSRLRRWLDPLDPDVVTRDAEHSGELGFKTLPSFHWAHDGWELSFHAFPLRASARDLGSALGMTGPGEAQVVDNITGLLRALEDKYGRYGPLSAPLVIAGQSNTLFPTKDYEVERVLFGEASRRPYDPSLRPADLFSPGFWRDRGGWRRGDCPQVISIAGLAPWTVVRTQPRLWATLESTVGQPDQPGWLAPVHIGAEPTADDSSVDLAGHFDLDQGFWLSDPDFEIG